MGTPFKVIVILAITFELLLSANSKKERIHYNQLGADIPYPSLAILYSQYKLREEAKKKCGPNSKRIDIKKLSFTTTGCGHFDLEKKYPKDPNEKFTDFTHFACYPNIHSSATIECFY